MSNITIFITFIIIGNSCKSGRAFWVGVGFGLHYVGLDILCHYVGLDIRIFALYFSF